MWLTSAHLALTEGVDSMDGTSVIVTFGPHLAYTCCITNFKPVSWILDHVWSTCSIVSSVDIAITQLM